MSSTLLLYIIILGCIKCFAQFSTSSLLIEEHQKLATTILPIINKSDEHSHSSFIDTTMSHEAPIFVMVLSLLILVICGCIGFLCYKHLTTKAKRNIRHSVESESENENENENEYESTTQKTLTISERGIKKRHADPDSDFDVVTKDAFVSHIVMPLQNSIIQNTNAIYGINTDAILQSPSVVVIKHNTDAINNINSKNKNKLQVVVEKENYNCSKSKSDIQSKSIFDSPPSNVFIDSPDSVNIQSDANTHTQFVFISDSENNNNMRISEANTYDSMRVCNGSANTSDTYASEGQQGHAIYEYKNKRKKGRQSTKDSVLEQLKKSVNQNYQLEENEFEVMGSPPLSPVSNTQQ